MNPRDDKRDDKRGADAVLGDPNWICLRGEHDGAAFEVMTGGTIKIEVAGSVHVRTVREWHELAVKAFIPSHVAPIGGGEGGCAGHPEVTVASAPSTIGPNAWEEKFNAECAKHDATTARAMKAERELAEVSDAAGEQNAVLHRVIAERDQLKRALNTQIELSTPETTASATRPSTDGMLFRLIKWAGVENVNQHPLQQELREFLRRTDGGKQP